MRNNTLCERKRHVTIPVSCALFSSSPAQTCGFDRLLHEVSQHNTTATIRNNKCVVSMAYSVRSACAASIRNNTLCERKRHVMIPVSCALSSSSPAQTCGFHHLLYEVSQHKTTAEKYTSATSAHQRQTLGAQMPPYGAHLNSI